MYTEFSSSDCDELSESLSNTEQEFRQLEAGKFFGQWRLLELPGVWIVEDRISHGIYNSAAISDGFSVVFIPIRQPGTLNFNGHSWDDRCIFMGRQETQQILAIPNDFASYTVEFDLSCLHSMAEALGSSLPPQRSNMDVITNSAVRDAATQLIAQAYRTHADSSRFTPQQRADRLVAGWLNVLRETAGESETADLSTSHQRRRAALDAANCMRQHFGRDLSLANLCQLVGVTDRTLRNGFQEMFGMSPNRWWKVERLTAARRDLKAADGRLGQVGTIASKYGFTQFAHFATDYRKQFGESPSETLRR